MSNPTLLSENFDGSLGSFSGSGPERYDSGLWLEEATTNDLANPILANNANFWGTYGGSGARVTGQSIVHPVSGSTITTGWRSDFANGPPNFGAFTVYGSWSLAQDVAGSWVVLASGTAVGKTLRTTLSMLGGANATSNVGAVDTVLTGVPQLIETTRTVDYADRNRIDVFAQNISAVAAGTDVIVATAGQLELKAYTTSYVDGSLGTGYAWTSTAHASASTRAASSASVTIAEPVSVACWYREGYSGAKTFAYIEPYGALGTYGSIAYAAGDLTISTSRNLVIGPFAAFDRVLTSKEQANLQRTQNWTNKTVFGPNPYTTYQMRPY